MRTLMAPVFWTGRVFLWGCLTPVGIWRSIVHHRKKAERRNEKLIAKALDRKAA